MTLSKFILNYLLNEKIMRLAHCICCKGIFEYLIRYRELRLQFSISRMQEILATATAERLKWLDNEHRLFWRKHVQFTNNAVFLTEQILTFCVH